MKLRNIALALVFIAITAGCGDTPTPTQVAVPSSSPVAQQGTPSAVAPRPQVTTPTFNFMPRRGAAGTIVNLAGANFKPGSKVILRIGTPQPVGEAIATADVGTDGRWNASATIPGTLPSGQPIQSQGQGDVQLVAMDDANNIIASEPFGFLANASPVSLVGDPAQPVSDFLNSLKADPTGKSASKYLSQSMQSQLSSSGSVATLLGIDAIPSDFKVGATTQGSSPNAAEVIVTLTVNGKPVERSFELSRALNQWSIEAVSK